MKHPPSDTPTTDGTTLVPMPAPYRPDTWGRVQRVNFVLGAGGIGDYTANLVALTWIQKHYPHVAGVVWSPANFMEVARLALAPWDVRPRWELTDEDIKHPTYIPDPKLPINVVGASLVDMGFILYANRNKAPVDAVYPSVIPDLSPTWRGVLPEKYVVIAAGHVDANRELPLPVIKAVAQTATSLGLRVVVLGKDQINEHYKATFSPHLESALPPDAINLVSATTLLEALAIMANAKAVVGMDGGLLHLAALTDVPIVFGYTVVGPEYRRPPRRPTLKTIDVLPPGGCQMCMEWVRFKYDHNFKTCLYKDNECVTTHAMNPTVWVEAFKEALR